MPIKHELNHDDDCILYRWNPEGFAEYWNEEHGVWARSVMVIKRKDFVAVNAEVVRFNKTWCEPQGSPYKLMQEIIENASR